MRMTAAGTHKRNLLIAFGMVALLFVWLALSVSGGARWAVEQVRTVLPEWFPAVNLLLAPLLGGLVAAPLRLPRAFRLLLFVLLLCSFSAFFLSYQRYPIIASVVVVAMFLEAFVIIPRWNASQRKTSDPSGDR